MQTLKGYAGKKDDGVLKRLPQIVKSRMPGGKFYNNITNDIASKVPLGRRMFNILVYFAGSSLSALIFPKMDVRIIGEYTAKDYLYHITPVENIEKMKKDGIVSKRNYIFLTDDVDYFVNGLNYLNWKSTELNKNTEFCVIKIDACALEKRHRIFYIDRKHEFVTKQVEPEFLVFD